MKVFAKCRRRRFARLSALTRLEVMVMIAAFVLFLIVGLAAASAGYSRSLARRHRIACVNNLKTIGLAFRISFITKDGFPWKMDANEGGSKEHLANPTALWRHLAAISNELSTPKLLICPSDRERAPARTFPEITNNEFVSYALGFSASEDTPQSILGADRNVLHDGVPLANVIVSFPRNAAVTFDRRVHQEAGNLLLGDGSVQQVSSRSLGDRFREAHRATGTNVLAFP